MYLELNSEALMERLMGEMAKKIPIIEVEYEGEDKPSKPNKPKPSDYYLAVAEKIHKRAIEYTPVDTGKLRDSIYIKPYESGFEIGYTCDYALYVHEIGFNYHEPPTQYKFLEDAAYEVVVEFMEETKMDIPVTIEYNPLRVFIGSYDYPGEELASIRTVATLTQYPDVLEKMWQGLVNHNPDTASEEEKLHYQKMEEFFDYWSIRGHNSWNILSEWADRNRHD